MKLKSKKQLTKEFLEKIKTINIGTSGKTLGDLQCPGCGHPIKEHNLVPVAIGGVMKIPRKRVEKVNANNEEIAFAT